MQSAFEYVTVPELAILAKKPLDWVRKQLRKRKSEFEAFFIQVGPTRLLPKDRVDEFLDKLKSCGQ